MTLQDVLDSLSAFLGPIALLLSPVPAASDSKGVQQANPLLLLVDAQLAEFPFEGLPQLKAASAVVRDFSMHVHHSRMMEAAARPVGQIQLSLREH